MSTLKFILVFAALGSILLMSASEALESKTYKVDVENSTLSWVGKKVTGEHSGNISLESGKFQFTDGKLSDGEFVIDMTSITVTDIQGEYAGKLLGHLKSDDFFGVDKFNTSSIHLGQNDFTVTIKNNSESKTTVSASVSL